jgi:hypothetical protein
MNIICFIPLTYCNLQNDEQELEDTNRLLV